MAMDEHTIAVIRVLVQLFSSWLQVPKVCACAASVCAFLIM